uniref:Uncharacterized protein n=1 Tax=Anguilla anguilla TaxID=7936 RepID=A0A0E9RDI9_ANGAN
MYSLLKRNLRNKQINLKAKKKNKKTSVSKSSVGWREWRITADKTEESGSVSHTGRQRLDRRPQIWHQPKNLKDKKKKQKKGN